MISDGRVAEITVERPRRKSMVGNIYLGRVARVLPGMQAAFVSVGLGRNAFLHADDARALVLGPIDERPQEGRDEPEEEEDTSTPEGDQRASGVGEDADEAGDDVAASDDAAAAAAESGRPRRLPIEECVSEGQVILVQVTKDAVKGKGARLTTNLSIPGRHLVLTPFQAGIGISRRIEEEEERERLRSVMEGIAGPESGFIVRTASRGVGEDELRRMRAICVPCGPICALRPKAPVRYRAASMSISTPCFGRCGIR